MDYHVLWYIIMGLLLMGYAVLDGFDLGAGSLHLFSKGDHERRVVLNSIGPVWDGNEVWLITAGGALFAAFPEIYATAFSGLYLPFMFLLFSLIFRAVSIEFRSKEESLRWRKFWDMGFSSGSIISTILYGIAIGNIIDGLPIGADKEFHGNILSLLSPYTILTGVFNLSLFSLHGAMYLILKTEGDQQARMKKLTLKLYGVFFILYTIVTVTTLIKHPEMLANFSFAKITPLASHSIIENNIYLISIISWAIVILNILAIANIPRCLMQGKELQGFISSACTVMAVVLFFALGLFPNMLVSNIDPKFSLDIYNGASSVYTLTTMFYVAIIGMPFVLLYTGLIYWTYRGKTKVRKESY
ncbi:MAG: cytochrome d ubiquinol oxidase subunit II [Bdellovibrio sp.]|nr:cytochrome d ubiquinol oxidase subunit II [Bdellovibrio sp.]